MSNFWKKKREQRALAALLFDFSFLAERLKKEAEERQKNAMDQLSERYRLIWCGIVTQLIVLVRYGLAVGKTIMKYAEV